LQETGARCHTKKAIQIHGDFTLVTMKSKWTILIFSWNLAVFIILLMIYVFILINVPS